MQGWTDRRIRTCLFGQSLVLGTAPADRRGSRGPVRCEGPFVHLTSTVCPTTGTASPFLASWRAGMKSGRCGSGCRGPAKIPDGVRQPCRLASASRKLRCRQLVPNAHPFNGSHCGGAGLNAEPQANPGNRKDGDAGFGYNREGEAYFDVAAHPPFLPRRVRSTRAPLTPMSLSFV